MLVPGLQARGADGRGDAGPQWPWGSAGEAVPAAMPEVRQGWDLEFQWAVAGRLAASTVTVGIRGYVRTNPFQSR